MNLRSKRILTKLAKDLRKNQTIAESILWNKLRNSKLAGIKFRRQEPIGNYIVDFISFEINLIIEIDGSIHEKQKDYDKFRTSYLQDIGFYEIRFKNEQIIHDIEFVLQKILDLCKKLK